MAGFALAPAAGGNLSKLDISTTTVIKATPGVLAAISVTTAGTAAGGAYDAATTSGNTAANLIGNIAATATAAPLVFQWPCLTGILIVPPTGGVVSVSYS